MKRIIRILSSLLIVVLLIGSVSGLVCAAEGEQALNVEVDAAYGGAKGIVTMTFDDGDYETAKYLQTLCEKYDLYATLMLVAGRINSASGKTVEEWNEIFESGRIEPQSHSMTHDPALGTKNEGIITEAILEREIVDSYEALSEFFQDTDILCYAPRGGANQYNCLTDEARALAMSTYYMIRGAGDDALQNISPSFNFGELGSWSYIPSISVDNQPLNVLKQRINDTVSNGAWYCAYGHKIAESGGSLVSAYDTIESWFAYIDTVRDRGDIWVTTISSAVKYIRERQNTVVTATLSDGKIIVEADMAEKTQDGLDLPTEVFNQPLSVKIEVPNDMVTVRYAFGGECRTASSFVENDRRYVRIDVLPESVVTIAGIDEDDTPHDLEFIKGEPSTCLAGGTVDHNKCRACGQIFDSKGNPLETIENNKLGKHDLVDVPKVEATETEEGNIAHKACSVCNKKFNAYGVELDDVSIPMLEPDVEVENDGFAFTEIIRNPLVIALIVIIVIVLIVLI